MSPVCAGLGLGDANESDTTDWTASGSRSNSSPEFEFLCAKVEQLIRSDAHILLAGRADQTAGLIVAQLAHVYGLAPTRPIGGAGG